jgi:hypothetical protein
MSLFPFALLTVPREREAQVAEVLPSSTSLVELKVQKKRGRPPKLKQPTSPKKRARKRKQDDAQAGEGLSGMGLYSHLEWVSCLKNKGRLSRTASYSFFFIANTSSRDKTILHILLHELTE